MAKIHHDKEESLAKIAVFCISSTALAQIISAQAKREKDSISEISLVNLSIASHYSRLFKAKMVYI